MLTRQIVVRRATPADQKAIEALVRSERLNPNQLHWPNFLLAQLGEQIVGAVQMRRHADGSCELGSLVVVPAHRGRGVARLLIDRLLDAQFATVHVVTARADSRHYERWGFRPVAPAAVPRAVRRNWRLGQILGGAVALLSGRAPRRLVILKRP